MRRLIVTAALALTFTASATAATLGDLSSLGYTVAKASDCQAGTDTAGAPVWKVTWSVSGYGVSTYLSECAPSFQADLDSLANPAFHFERKWQHEHPDQVQAAQTIAGKCYSIGRTAPATDSWRITALLVDITVPGADLPGLAGTLADRKAADGSCTGTTTAIVPSTGAGGTITVPGQVAITPVAEPVAVTAEAVVSQPTAPAVPVGTSAEVQAAADKALAEAQLQGLPPDEVALTVRSAGLNALYGLGG